MLFVLAGRFNAPKCISGALLTLVWESLACLCSCWKITLYGTTPMFTSGRRRGFGFYVSVTELLVRLLNF